MPTEILESSFEFVFYLLVSLIILSTTVPLQNFYVKCEVVEAKEILETFAGLGQMLEENMYAIVSLEGSLCNGRTIFRSDGKNVSIIFEDKIFYSMICDGIEFYEQEVRLYGKVVVSKINGKIMVGNC